MATRLTLLLGLLLVAIVILSIMFHTERKRERSEEIRQIVMDAEQSLKQSRNAGNSN